jgi:hypothetical protein
LLRVAGQWVPNVIDLALVNATRALDWLPEGSSWAWDEINFSNWVNYNSSLFVKMLPVQIWGQEGYEHPEWVPNHTLVWADGRLLVHSTSVRTPSPPSPSSMPCSCSHADERPEQPEKWELPARVDAPLLWQTTWDWNVQRPGP